LTIFRRFFLEQKTRREFTRTKHLAAMRTDVTKGKKSFIELGWSSSKRIKRAKSAQGNSQPRTLERRQ